ncbi:MAG: hypothetical protein KJ886_01155 [Candidatus Thermoplasmatota archaeon]|nr:hypothetical protein [Candidatus Thermoplasmatota archaeon]
MAEIKMDKKTNNINCPECGAVINVSDILYHQVEEQIAKDFEAKNAKNDKDLQKKLKDLH